MVFFSVFTMLLSTQDFPVKLFYIRRFISAPQQPYKEGICIIPICQKKKKLRPRETKRLTGISEQKMLKPARESASALAQRVTNRIESLWCGDQAPRHRQDLLIKHADCKNKSVQENVRGVSTHCNIQPPKEKANSKPPS